VPEVRRPDVYADDPTAGVYDSSKARDKLGFVPTRDWRTLLAPG
jgi:hypothetical protein